MATTVGRSADRSKDYTLREWLHQWLRLCAVRGLRETTLEAYRFAVARYVTHELSSMRIRDIDSLDLNAHYEWMLREGRHDGRGGLSPKTVKFVQTVIRRALADAVELRLLDRNPAVAAQAPSRRAFVGGTFRTWTPSELRRFLDSTRDEPLHAAFYVAATTGLRRGEVLGLRWCDIDFEQGQLHVVQGVVVVRREIRFGPPKSQRSRRCVALDRQTLEVLGEKRRAKEARAAGAGTAVVSELVFTTAAGGPIHPALLTYHFRRCVLAAGLPPIRLHDLRHTHATHALQAGVHPKIVSERLGHSTIGITLDTYSHVLPNMQREAAEAVAALIAAA